VFDLLFCSSNFQHPVKLDLVLIWAGQVTSVQTTSAVPKSAYEWPDILLVLPLFA